MEIKNCWTLYNEAQLNELEEYDNVVRLAREKYLMKRPGEDVFVIRRQLPSE